VTENDAPLFLRPNPHHRVCDNGGWGAKVYKTPFSTERHIPNGMFYCAMAIFCFARLLFTGDLRYNRSMRNETVNDYIRKCGYLFWYSPEDKGETVSDMLKAFMKEKK
jgi:hypothetical protein